MRKICGEKKQGFYSWNKNLASWNYHSWLKKSPSLQSWKSILFFVFKFCLFGWEQEYSTNKYNYTKNNPLIEGIGLVEVFFGACFRTAIFKYLAAGSWTWTHDLRRKTPLWSELDHYTSLHSPKSLLHYNVQCRQLPSWPLMLNDSILSYGLYPTVKVAIYQKQLWCWSSSVRTLVHCAVKISRPASRPQVILKSQPPVYLYHKAGTQHNPAKPLIKQNKQRIIDPQKTSRPFQHSHVCLCSERNLHLYSFDLWSQPTLKQRKANLIRHTIH